MSEASGEPTVRGPHCPACGSDQWFPDQHGNPNHCVRCDRFIGAATTIEEMQLTDLAAGPQPGPYQPTRLEIFVLALLRSAGMASAPAITVHYARQLLIEIDSQAPPP